MFYLLTLPTLADTVLTTAGRHTGALRIENSRIRIGAKTTPWADTMAVITTHKRRITAPNVLTLRTGERWSGTVLGLDRSQLRFRLEQGGERSIDLQRIAAADFFAGRTAEGGHKAGRLYRTDGSSLKGKLLDISPAGVRIASAIGVFNLPRSEALRYVFGPIDAAPANGDQLALVNGSVYHGAVQPDGRAFRVDHALLGKLRIAPATVMTIRRDSERWQWLQGATWESQAASDPLGSPALPARVSRNSPAHVLRPPPWVTAVRIDADTTVHVDAIPARDGQFMALVTLADGPPGASIESVNQNAAGSRHEFARPEETAHWSFDINAGTNLQLRVRFGETISMPCTMLIGDPVIVWR